ncbi:MAG: hypothetical protein V7632_4478 [Bradyrhizobium sp.]|jgi:hypothetical protein
MFDTAAAALRRATMSTSAFRANQCTLKSRAAPSRHWKVPRSNMGARSPVWVIRDWSEPAAIPVTSAAPPKEEVNSACSPHERSDMRGAT